LLVCLEWGFVIDLSQLSDCGKAEEHGFRGDFVSLRAQAKATSITNTTMTL
jgi:hypothetical protein